MSKHILFTNGILSARYDSLIHGKNIPVEAVEVDDALFFKTINEIDGQWILNADGSITKEPLTESAPYIPKTVTMRQARLALLQSGLLDKVNAAISAGTQADNITWEYATEVNRNDDLVVNLSNSLDLTSQQLDDLFTLAASL